MLDKLELENVLVLDIETVSAFKSFAELEENWQLLWEKKCERLKAENETAADFYKNAGIYAEFGRIICISVGFFTKDEEGKYNFRVKSFSGHDEKEVLSEFNDLLDNYYSDINRYLLCGHNSKEFDFPYICRRSMINGLKLPRILNISGLKPWEVPHLDTMQLWRFGDFKSYTSLNLLAAAFNIPTPKDDIDGSQVGHVYWKDNDLKRIVSYCQKDVLTVAQLLLKFRCEPLLTEDQVVFVED